MHIMPITRNYVNRVKTSSKPCTFESDKREDSNWNAGLKYLAGKTTEIYDGIQSRKLYSVMNELGLKYACLGLRNITFLQIENRDLSTYLGKNAKRFDLRDKVGLCAIMGEPEGDVSQMDYIYEVRLFLEKPENIDRFFNSRYPSHVN